MNRSPYRPRRFVKQPSGPTMLLLGRQLDALSASHKVLQAFVDELHDRVVQIEPPGVEARRVIERCERSGSRTQHVDANSSVECLAGLLGSGFPWTPEEFQALKAGDSEGFWNEVDGDAEPEVET